MGTIEHKLRERERSDVEPGNRAFRSRRSAGRDLAIARSAIDENTGTHVAEFVPGNESFGDGESFPEDESIYYWEYLSGYESISIREFLLDRLFERTAIGQLGGAFDSALDEI